MTDTSKLVRPTHTNSGRVNGKIEVSNKYSVIAPAEDLEDMAISDPYQNDTIENAETIEPEVALTDPYQDWAIEPPPAEAQQPSRVKAITQPIAMTQTQREQHWLEAHVNYHPVNIA